MSVRKRKWTTKAGEAREAWIVDYVDQNGERHIETFGRQSEAKTREAQVKVDVGQGIHTATNKSITVAEAAQDWLAYVQGEGRERTTIEQYRQHVVLHIEHRLGNTKLAALTTPRIEAFRDDLLSGMSRPMAKKVLGSLKSLLKDAKRRGNVAQNVARDTKVSLGKRSKRKLKVGVDIPLPAEIKAIVGAAHGRGRAFLIVAAFSGLRASELRGLRWSDVDFGAEPKIHVRQRANKYGTIGNPKSEASNREVPIGPMVINTLRERRLQSTGDFVFANGAGNVEDHSNLVRRVLQPVQVAAGLTVDGKAKYTGLHALRHFYASWLINARESGGLGLPPKEVQVRMGHATLAMTMDTYGHLFPRADHAAEIAAAEQALFGVA